MCHANIMMLCWFHVSSSPVVHRARAHKVTGGHTCVLVGLARSIPLRLLRRIRGPSRPQATDYESIVTNQTNVEKVLRHVKSGRYSSVEAFFSDLLLVYRNAKRYYEEGGKHKDIFIYEAAKVTFLCADSSTSRLSSPFRGSGASVKSGAVSLAVLLGRR